MHNFPFESNNFCYFPLKAVYYNFDVNVYTFKTINRKYLK